MDHLRSLNQAIKDNQMLTDAGITGQAKSLKDRRCQGCCVRILRGPGR